MKKKEQIQRWVQLFLLAVLAGCAIEIWEENAQFWDNAMGDESNEFHREVLGLSSLET